MQGTHVVPIEEKEESMSIREWLHVLRSEPRIVDKTPLVSVALLEAANVQQLFRMWSEHTAAGQSLWAWMTVNVALWLWVNFYVVFNRDNKFAIYGTALGIVMNTLVILTIIWFRYFAGVV